MGCLKLYHFCLRLELLALLNKLKNWGDYFKHPVDSRRTNSMQTMKYNIWTHENFQLKMHRVGLTKWELN